MLTYLDTAIGFAVVMLAISLLITIATQIVSALLNHRGSNLLWGLKTLFSNIDPGLTHLRNGSEWLAEHVLTHCLISDSLFSNSGISRAAARVPGLGSLVGRFKLASAIRSGELVSILNYVAAALPAMDPPPDPKRVPSPAALAGDIKDLVNGVNQTAGRLEQWFGSMMDRVSQRFAMWMRIWTVAFAATFALGTGLNAIHLVEDIYRNGSLRDALISAAQQVGTSASSVLNPQNSLPALYSQILLKTLADAGVPAPNPAPVIQTTAEGTAWINAHVPAANLQAVLRNFNTSTDAATRKFITDNAETATALIQSKAGIAVLRWNWRDFPSKPKKAQVKYLLGVLLTTALLSLGAPFWFNSLKSLTNLRPIMASKEKAEQQQGT
jgi:hypothetical protein